MLNYCIHFNKKIKIRVVSKKMKTWKRIKYDIHMYVKQYQNQYSDLFIGLYKPKLFSPKLFLFHLYVTVFVAYQQFNTILNTGVLKIFTHLWSAKE